MQAVYVERPRLASVRRLHAEFGPVRCWLLISCLFLPGCVHFGRRGPVAQDVIIARQLSQQGLDALHDGDYLAAEERFAQAIDHCPSNTDARYQLANCLWKRGATHEAIAQLQEALKLAGYDDVEMIVELGYMQANVDRLDLAREAAEEAIRMAPDLPAAWRLLGDVQREENAWQASLASYHRSLAYDPHNLEVQLATAEIYARLNRPARVLATLHPIEDQIPPAHRPESMVAIKAQALAALDRPADAIQVLAEAAEQRELSTKSLALLAQLQASAGQSLAAERTVERALRRADAGQDESLRRMLAQLVARRAAVSAETSEPWQR